ncbi:MAG: electron transfer flavoprotein subunit alpha/FixB family protein [Bryobacteraceae bacterium]|nr:electron transfer flavoprotein subunit alpha/FixB family protein [Bryobacteraceae bacterium]MCX7605205.1 electron transfer flavoprotein subunit alpha/FixB family protein [Bryobacteraceae bacterium]
MSGILAILERGPGGWHRMSFEALAGALELGRATGEPVTACVPGFGVEAAAAEAAAFGPAAALALEHEALSAYAADAWIEALGALIGAMAPSWVVLPHTYQTRDFAPALAARFGRALMADCTGFVVEGGRPVFERQLFQGKLTGRFLFETPKPNFVSFQAGAFRAPQAAGQRAPVAVQRADVDPARVRQKPEAPFREAAQAVDLSSAERIVAVGRGIGDEGNLELARELAAALGAELAASRPICDNGWLPMDRQVGSSGQTVAPKLYVALGISGAIQHVVGMKGSGCIVAVNRDPQAPIFEIADYGIVGDLFEVAPALIEELKKSAG